MSVALRGFMPIRPIEILVVVALTIFGLGVRAWHVSEQGLDHFDEGVYVASGLALSGQGADACLYPRQERFAPLAFPLIVAASFAFAGGASDTAARFGPLLLGTLTIPVIWAIGRSWFGPRAAIIAAACVTLNELHIALSRAVLTDVPFALFFAVSLAALVRALRTGSIVAALGAGVAVALAWHTKYHGWFAIVIAAGAVLGTWFHDTTHRTLLFGRAAILAIAGASAAALYIPWVLYVQSQPGGYAALASYQRGMLSREWLHNLMVQLQDQRYFDGWPTRLSLIAGMACVLIIAPRARALSPKAIAGLVTVAVSSLLAGFAGTAVALGVLVPLVPWDDRRVLPALMTAAWIALWLVSTPLYFPYARLVLPLILALSLAAGAVLDRLMDDAVPRARAWLIVPAFAGTIALAAFFGAVPGRVAPVWQPTPGLRDAATAIAANVTPGEPVIVFGEPALSFYLRRVTSAGGAVGSSCVEPLARARALRSRGFVVTGLYARTTPVVQHWLEDNRQRLMRIGEFPMEPGPVRLLDDHPPDALARSPNARSAYTLTLYRFVPAGGAFHVRPAHAAPRAADEPSGSLEPSLNRRRAAG